MTARSLLIGLIAASFSVAPYAGAQQPVSQPAGSVAVGAYPASAFSDGSNVTFGFKADAATCALSNTAMACLRQLHSDLIAPLPPGTNAIGSVTALQGGAANSLTNPFFFAPSTGSSDAGGVGFQTTAANYILAGTTVSFTRPANTTQYSAVGQEVCTNTTTCTALAFTGAARYAGGSLQIPSIRLCKSTASLTAAYFRIHAFIAAPTVTSGDGALIAQTGLASWIGSFDVTMAQAFSDGACGVATPTSGSTRISTFPSGSTLYFTVEARATYTPASGETFSVTPEILRP